jgi:hypothetical protein
LYSTDKSGKISPKGQGGDVRGCQHGCLIKGGAMDNQREVENDFVPEDWKPGDKGTAGRRRGWWLWLLVFPLAACLACLGLMVFAAAPLFHQTRAVDIPVTGNDPTLPAGPQASPTQKPSQAAGTQQPEGTPLPGLQFLKAVRQSLESCSGSFQEYFLLEELAVDHPDVFQSKKWRTDATNAMNLFHEDCQTLGTLPDAPPAYAEVDHWLKLAAGEVEPATTSFSAALEKQEAGQFQISIKHMLMFVDYIHNAEGAMNGMLQRKEI